MLHVGLSDIFKRIKNVTSYQAVGIISWLIVPPAFGLLVWARGPRGFASLIGLLPGCFAFWLTITYISLLFRAYLDRKNAPLRQSHWLIHLGYVLGLIFIIYTFAF